MSGFNRIILKEMIVQLGEDKTKSILSDFYCPMNQDVQDFIRNKAIPSSNQGFSSTHLIFTSYKGKECLVGYFTLSSKQITVSQKSMRSFNSHLRSRVKVLALKDMYLNQYVIPAPLIAQLGKNFKNSWNTLISGDELLKIAIDTIAQLQLNIGGRFAYLECEDKEKLLSFYRGNGFVEYGKRNLDKDETNIDGQYLIQLLKYIR